MSHSIRIVAVSLSLLCACSGEGGDALSSGGEGNAAPGASGDPRGGVSSATPAPLPSPGSTSGSVPPPDAGGGTGPSSSGPEPSGVFVAVGYGGRRIRSVDDGRTWTDDVSAVANGGDDDMLLRAVVHANGEFVALGYRAVRSTDGKTWQPLSAPFGQWIGAVVWDKTRFVAVGGYGLHATSPDGTTWSDHPIDHEAAHAHDAIAAGGGRFVAANDLGGRSTSADGITWVKSTGAASTATTAVAFGNGAFVALGGTAVARSTDGGLTFTAGAPLPRTCRGLVFAQGHFTALADGHVLTSSDGLTWLDTASSNAHRGLVAYGHGTYVSLGGAGRQRSSDGVAWEAPITDKSQNPLEAIAFGPL
jgi:hypothetical protein